MDEIFTGRLGIERNIYSREIDYGGWQEVVHFVRAIYGNIMLADLPEDIREMSLKKNTLILTQNFIDANYETADKVLAYEFYAATGNQEQKVFLAMKWGFSDGIT